MNSVKIIKKNVKNLTLRINSLGEVSLSVPLKFPDFLVQDFLNKKSSWIMKKLEIINSNKKNSFMYENGDELDFLGKKYTLKIHIGYFEKVEIFQNELVVSVTNDSFIDKQKILNAWYSKKAKEIFYPIVFMYSRLIDKEVKAVRIRKMNTRWGSCNHNKNYINLNLEMVKKPIEFIEFVILHEVCHLVHPNHSKKFYDFLSSHMPDWRERAKKAKFL